MRPALLLPLALLLAGCLPDNAQPASEATLPPPSPEQIAATTGVLVGEVLGADGTPAGEVTVLLPDIDISAETDAFGRFAIPDLSEGRYDIEAIPQGHERAQAISGVEATAGTVAVIRAGDTTRVSLTLPPAGS
jgi:hypothetical protein